MLVIRAPAESTGPTENKAKHTHTQISPASELMPGDTSGGSVSNSSRRPERLSEVCVEPSDAQSLVNI